MMKLPHRRQFLHLAAAAAVLPAVPRIARAQTYPARSVRIITAGAPGVATDILARISAQWLSERLGHGQPFVVENRTGAGGNIAAEAVVRASADGYTLLLIGANYTINAVLYEKLNYDFIRDIAPVAAIVRLPNVVVVNPSFPATSIPEFIAYAKANPGKVNFASNGSGTSIHMSGELFKLMTGVDMVHVPYRGGAGAQVDLMGGRVQVMFDNLPASIELIRTGKLRALAVTTADRWSSLPDIPTVGEFVPGFEVSTVGGIGAPKNTPSNIIETLNKELNAGLKEATMKQRLTELGGDVLVLSPTQYGNLLAAEVEKWRKVVKSAGIKAE
jgi:tripartite-type tricarboxylate transporter receptor subunit TctC